MRATPNRPLRVLVACEFSGIVRDAFAALGHDAWSCDLLPSESPGQHLQCDVRTVLPGAWDLMVAHPPCTHLAVSGARWFKGKERQQREALNFVRDLLFSDVPHIALENPRSIISTQVRKPDQCIQPWQYGHGEVKATFFWLKSLPVLRPTKLVTGRVERVFRNVGPGPDRWKIRSRTYLGVAKAMADQWGGHVRDLREAVTR